MIRVAVSPPPGIFSDDTAFAAGPVWVDCNNVRFVEGKPQAIGGWANQQAVAASSNGIIRAIFPFTRAGAIVIAYGTTNSGSSGAKLLVGATSAGGNPAILAPADRTPVGISSSTPHWSLDSWGETLLACPHGGTLYDQSGTSTAAEVTEAPDRIDAGILVTDQRQVLAFGANEVGGSHNPMCIRVSDIEDYSSAGSWTPAATNNADEIILEGHGTIVAGCKLGAYIIVWTQTGLYLGQFIGDPGQSYRFDMVDESSGLIGPKAFAVLNGRLYWMAPDLTVRSYALGEQPQVVTWPASEDFAANVPVLLTPRQNIAACGLSRYEEIWFHYRDNRTSDFTNNDNNRFVAFCVGESRRAQRPVWFRGQAGRTAMADSGLLSSATYGIAGAAPTIIAATSNGANSAIYLHETGRDMVPNRSPYVTSGDFALEEGGRRMMIRGCIPDFEDQAGDTNNNPNGDISLRVFVRQRPQDTPIEKGPYQLATTTMKKDFRASGNLVSVKLSLNGWSGGAEGASTPQGGYFRLGKLVFDVVPMGER